MWVLPLVAGCHSTKARVLWPGCAHVTQGYLLLVLRCAVLSAQAILRAHRAALQAGQAALLEREVLFGEDVEQLLRSHPPTEEPVLSGNGSGVAAGASSGNGGGIALPVGAQ
jgi:hypothetical protein